ncbi:MAG: universal stress protein [Candidatus Odinarchaeota archaeon]
MTEEQKDRYISMGKSLLSKVSKQDEFFTRLDSILLPLAGENFEWAGIQIARFIATEYGAKVIIFHRGSKDLTPYVKPFEEFKIQTEIITKSKSSGHTADLIVEEAGKSDYQLMVIPSRRRPKWLDRFLTWESVSAKVIPRVKFNTLQVYEPRGRIFDLSNSSGMGRVAILLPRTERDLYLIFYANSLLSSNGKLFTYHFADLPYLTPLRESFDSEIIVQEKKEYETIVESYSTLFSTHITPKFILAHDLVKAATRVINSSPLDESPEIVLIGQSMDFRLFRLRTISDKLIDRLKPPVAVHYWSKEFYKYI